jgi:hypothetical protein
MIDHFRTHSCALVGRSIQDCTVPVYCGLQEKVRSIAVEAGYFQVTGHNKHWNYATYTYKETLLEWCEN